MKLNELSPAEGSTKQRMRIGRGVGSGKVGCEHVVQLVGQPVELLEASAAECVAEELVDVVADRGEDPALDR